MARMVTIKHVAQRAGVSVGTVSRCLNGFSNIGPENARRVKKAVKDLKYRHCQSARMLVSRRTGGHLSTGNIGVYFPRTTSQWVSHPLLAGYVSGVEAACTERGLHSLIEFATADGGEHPPQFLVEHKVDGMLIKNASRASQWLKDYEKDFPIVGVGTAEPALPFPQVTPDNRAAGWQVAEYLWGRGHRRFAFVCSSPTLNQMFVHRRQGVEEFLQAHKSPSQELLTTFDIIPEDKTGGKPELSPPDMRAALDSLWSLPAADRPTAIVCANDWIAAGLYQAMALLGLRPGYDVSIVGFDNYEAFCCSLSLPLTSYAVPVTRTAYVATQVLIDRIESPKTNTVNSIQLIGGELVERQSVCTLNSRTDAVCT